MDPDLLFFFAGSIYFWPDLNPGIFGRIQLLRIHMFFFCSVNSGTFFFFLRVSDPGIRPSYSKPDPQP